ncbi:hypothetical protein [Endozoicomonas ascidiicola]|uniref:hypothetical protein n=1 Tax=Endozoicomonas ascidiicola TaxID=1698521 RepID=UPI0008362C04|nr:hypothetical protein [Endozoicomonas ascidiicola]
MSLLLNILCDVLCLVRCLSSCAWIAVNGNHDADNLLASIIQEYLHFGHITKTDLYIHFLDMKDR